MKQTAPYYGGNTPYRGNDRPLRPVTDFPRGGGNFVPSYLGNVPSPWPVMGVAGTHGAQTLQLSGAADSGALDALGYSAASLLGASLGGGLVGYISSHNRQGAMTGALFTAGVAGISDAVTLATQSRTAMAATIGLVGLASLSLSIYRFKKHR